VERTEPVRPRRVYVDSGPDGHPDDGQRVIVFRADGRELAPRGGVEWGGLLAIPPSGVLWAHTSLAMTNVMGIDLTEVRVQPEPGAFIRGFEGSDFVAVYYALDQLGEVFEGDHLEVVGDGSAINMLRGKGRVGVRWGGRDHAPILVERIREAEARFNKVDYEVIASAANPAGNLAKDNKRGAPKNRLKGQLHAFSLPC